MPKVTSISQSAHQFRDAALTDLHQRVPFDRALWGVGRKDEQRCMHIDLGASELVKIENGQVTPCLEGRSFMIQYNVSLCREDVVGRLFVHMPKIVQVVDIKKASVNRSTSKLWQYLRDAGVAHLLLVGTYSSFGYAWITLYRDSDKPFGLLQVEYASRSIPDSLYRWKLIVNGYGDKDNVVLPKKDKACPTTTSALNSRELFVLLGFMNGNSAEQIAEQLAPIERVSTDTVYQAHKSARDRLSGADDSPLGLIGAMSPRTF